MIRRQTQRLLQRRLDEYPAVALAMLRLDKAADMIKASRRFLVSKTRKTAGDEERASCNLSRLLRFLTEPA